MEGKSKKSSSISKKDKEKSSNIVSWYLPLGDKRYVFLASSSGGKVKITADEELRIDPNFYKTTLTQDDFNNLGKAFKLCDNMKELEKTFKFYIEEALRCQGGYDISLSQKKSTGELELNFRIMLAENQYSFNIKLTKTAKDKEIIIQNLRRIVDVYIQKYGKEDIIEDLNKNNSKSMPILKKKTPICFRGGPNYQLNAERTTATKINGNKALATVVAERPLPRNAVTTWKVKLTNYQTEYNLFIGVAPYDIDQSKNDNYKNSWSFDCFSCNLFLKGASWIDYGTDFDIKPKSKDVICVTMDTSTGTLSFSVNGVDFGVACDEIPTDIDVVPIVLMYQTDDCVELVL